MDLFGRVIFGTLTADLGVAIMMWAWRGFPLGTSRPPDTFEWAALVVFPAVVLVVTCTEWITEKISEELRDLGDKIDRLADRIDGKIV